MDRLPDEVILHILTYLEVIDAVRVQLVSRRFLMLGRDDSYWKIACFDQSCAEAVRRRQQKPLDTGSIAMRTVWSSIREVNRRRPNVASRADSSQARTPNAKALRVEALANWEPGYPTERLHYYDEYIHRHASIAIGWLDVSKCHSSGQNLEATGIGILRDDHGYADKVLSPMDDGSIKIWDISARETTYPGGQGSPIHSTRPGLLTGKATDTFDESHAIMTATGAVECVSINQILNRAYFAVQSLLHEVDLNTMQLVNTKSYPWPITTLSERQDDLPVTVGTNWTIHLHDPRDAQPPISPTTSCTELIGGSLYTHAALAQPGPLSILHHSTTSLWVAGRFTHLLNYDRRFLPRLLGTIHSGARIASLSSIPYPSPTYTIYTAGSYKGKGSLELYTPSPTPPGPPSSPSSPTTPPSSPAIIKQYQNRQTASSSKLLSVSPHGGMIVFSDGDGNIKWVERDGHTPVRTWNINPEGTVGSGGGRGGGGRPVVEEDEEGEVFGRGEQGDIVQKIIPCHTGIGDGGAGEGKRGRRDVNQSDLVVWTGDGRVGRLRFRGEVGGEEEFVDALEDQRSGVEERAREDAERQYGMAMRRALKRNADEVRFVRGLGIF